MEVKQNEKMKHFWNALLDIPKDVLFLRSEENTFSPYRWTPRRFLGLKHRVPVQKSVLGYRDWIKDHTTDAKLHKVGLVCKAPGLSIATLWKQPIGNSF